LIGNIFTELILRNLAEKISRYSSGGAEGAWRDKGR
jgi:hypothetical protein